MPGLTFKWDLKDHHPIVNEFGCDNISAFWSSWNFIEPSSRHLSFDVIIYLGIILLRKLREDLIWDVRSQYHTLDVVKDFIACLFSLTQKRLFVSRLPF
jgi:hypothetical protein